MSRAEEYQDLSQWEAEGEEHPPVENPTLQVRLTFNRHEVHVLGAAARQANLPLTTYIKRVLLDQACRTSGHS